MPLLRNVSPIEQDIVSRMYRMYDHDLKGQIPNYLARNLMSQLGIHITNLEVVFSQEVSLAEILLLLDQVGMILSFGLETKKKLLFCLS